MRRSPRAVDPPSRRTPSRTCGGSGPRRMRPRRAMHRLPGSLRSDRAPGPGRTGCRNGRSCGAGRRSYALPPRAPSSRKRASISPFPPTTPAAPFHASASRSSRTLPRRSLDPQSPRERAGSMIEPETPPASRREADPSGIGAGAASPVEVLVAGQGRPPAPASWLDGIVRPLATQEFLDTRYRDKRPVLFRSEGPRFASLCTWDALNGTAVLRRLAGPDAPRPGRQADPRALLHHAVLRPWMEIEKGRLERTHCSTTGGCGLPPQGRHHHHARSPGDPSPPSALWPMRSMRPWVATPGVNLYASWAATRGFATHWGRPRRVRPAGRRRKTLASVRRDPPLPAHPRCGADREAAPGDGVERGVGGG